MDHFVISGDSRTYGTVNSNIIMRYGPCIVLFVLLTVDAMCVALSLVFRGVEF